MIDTERFNEMVDKLKILYDIDEDNSPQEKDGARDSSIGEIPALADTQTPQGKMRNQGNSGETQTLSDKIVNNLSKQFGTEWVFKEDVRDAIRKLKDKLSWDEDELVSCKWVKKVIDKIMGAKLT